MSILRDLFGAGTWGAGGNFVAWILCGSLGFGWQHVKAKARHQQATQQRQVHYDEVMAQIAANHEDMKQHVTAATGTPPTAE